MATLEGYQRHEPEKPQVFKYLFNGARFGGELVYLRDVVHAIGNSDQYPVALLIETPEGRIQQQTIDAVANAIEACPRYKAAPCSLTEVTK